MAGAGLKSSGRKEDVSAGPEGLGGRKGRHTVWDLTCESPRPSGLIPLLPVTLLSLVQFQDGSLTLMHRPSGCKGSENWFQLVHCADNETKAPGKKLFVAVMG